MLILSICFGACRRDEPVVMDVRQVKIENVFPVAVTEMSQSSIIALPDGLNSEGFVINSEEMLKELIPAEIIDGDKRYKDIDFDKFSLLSLRYRLFYDISNIEYKVLTNEDGGIDVHEYIHVTGSMIKDGRFVMSNLLVDKIPADVKITLWQSTTFLE